MIEKMVLPLVLLPMILLNGCARLGAAPGTTEQQLVERDGVDVALIPAIYREVYFKPSTSTDRHCRAPDPDFSIQQNDQLSLALPGYGSENIGGGETQTEQNLGGRTEKVLITRELMYRACELTSNINADSDTSTAIYDKFLRVIEALTNSASQNGTVSTPQQ